MCQLYISSTNYLGHVRIVKRSWEVMFPGRREFQHKLCADCFFLAYCGQEQLNQFSTTDLQSDLGDTI